MTEPKTLEPCPFCSSRVVSIAPDGPGHSVQCRACCGTGPIGKNPDQAARLWDTRRYRPQPTVPDGMTIELKEIP